MRLYAYSLCANVCVFSCGFELVFFSSSHSFLFFASNVECWCTLYIIPILVFTSWRIEFRQVFSNSQQNFFSSTTCVRVRVCCCCCLVCVSIMYIKLKLYGFVNFDECFFGSSSRPEIEWMPFRRSSTASYLCVPRTHTHTLCIMYSPNGSKPHTQLLAHNNNNNDNKQPTTKFK